MAYDTILPFSFPAIRGKKLTAAFDGGRLSSDGGVMLLAQAAQRMGIAEKLAAVISDPRDPSCPSSLFREFIMSFWPSNGDVRFKRAKKGFHPYGS